MITTSSVPRRPRWRSLALLALCLAPLLWPLQHLAERYYRSELAGQNRQTLDLYVANLLGTLHRYEVLPQILGELPDLRAVLANPEDVQAQAKANQLLDDITAVCLINRAVCIASKPAPTGFVGYTATYSCGAAFR